MNGMVTVDARTRQAILAFAKDVFREQRDEMEEVWLSKDDFLRQFGMFTEDWLKRYGYLLPRVRVSVSDEVTGKMRCSQFAYARNAVQRLISENRLDFKVGENRKVRGGRG